MYFSDEDFCGIDPEHDNPMVIIIEVAKFVVMKTVVDQGSSMDILYKKTFRKMGLSQEAIIPHDKQIIGFSRERVKTLIYIPNSKKETKNTKPSK